MTFEDSKKLMEFADRHVQKGLANSKENPPCCKGCFHCCREPVYSTLSEVRFILSQLNNGEREALKPKLLEWRKKFLDGGFAREHMPNAFKYRALNLWCPLLINGECSIYENRPIACRMHVARIDKRGCEDDALRPKQEFATFPDLSEALTEIQLGSLQPGETETLDHFLCLVCQELIAGGAQSHITESRVDFYRSNDDELQVTLYGKPEAGDVPATAKLVYASNEVSTQENWPGGSEGMDKPAGHLPDVPC